MRNDPASSLEANKLTNISSGLEYFESLSKLEGRRFSSLESARILFAQLGNPQDQVPSVHVAGTNGKGTVSALIAAMLISHGKQVGQTCSPHLTDVCERCLVNGQPHQPQLFGAAIEEVVRASFQADIMPSYFVLGLAACFFEFARLKLDWMIIEVGLGGRLDASNVMARPAASVITNISFDHVELLGNTLGEIAEAKAGILKPGVPSFVGAVPRDARLAIEKEAEVVGTHVEFFGDDFYYDEGSSELVCSDVRHPLDLSRLSLRGRHQRHNAILAARVAYHLQAPKAAVHKGLAEVRWPGRLEFISASSVEVSPQSASLTPDYLLDVAHNVGGIEALTSHLREVLSDGRYRKLVFLLSALDRKDWRSMFGRLQSAVEEFRGIFDLEVDWIFTSSGHSSAVNPSEVAAVFPGGRAIQLPEEALAQISTANSLSATKTLVVVTGSVFLVGKVRPLLTDEPFQAYSCQSVYAPNTLNFGFSHER